MKYLHQLPNFLIKKIFQICDKNYIKNKLKKRKGKCNKCGECCKMCFYLDKKTKLCKVYYKRPILCYREFPLDKTDQEIWGVESCCGYRFIE